MTVERFLTLGSSVEPGRHRRGLAEVGASRVRNQQLGELSGGELQRVVLARALLREPNLLVLDEPVRGVDYAGEAELYNLDRRLRDEARPRRAARLARPARRHGAQRPRHLPQPPRVLLGRAGDGRPASRLRAPVRRGGRARLRRLSSSPRSQPRSRRRCRSPHLASRPTDPARGGTSVIEPFLRARARRRPRPRHRRRPARLLRRLAAHGLLRRDGRAGEPDRRRARPGAAASTSRWACCSSRSPSPACCIWFGRQKLVAARFHPRPAAPRRARRRRHRHLDDQGRRRSISWATCSATSSPSPTTDLAWIYLGGASCSPSSPGSGSRCCALRCTRSWRPPKASTASRVRTIFIVLLAVDHRRCHEDRRHPAGHGLPDRAGRRRPPVGRARPSAWSRSTALVAAASVLAGLWLSATVRRARRPGDRARDGDPARHCRSLGRVWPPACAAVAGGPAALWPRCRR